MSDSVRFEHLDCWWDKSVRNGPEAMAVDEWLLGSVDRPLLRVYRWLGEWSTLGYFDAWRNVRAAFPETQSVRRMTGGGLVDHRTDWTYTLVVPKSEVLANTRGASSYEWVHAALAETLCLEGLSAVMSGGEHVTGAAACFANPVEHDVIDAHGGKIAGAGQRRTRHGLLHQGSVAGKLTDAASHQRMLALASHLANGISTVCLTPPEGEIASLVAHRYATPAWNERR